MEPQAAGAFAAFIAVFFLFLYGIPQSSAPVSPQHNEQILPSPSVERPSRSDSISSRTSEKPQAWNELYGKIEQGREQLKNKNFGLARTEFKAAQALDNQHPLPLFYKRESICSNRASLTTWLERTDVSPGWVTKVTGSRSTGMLRKKSAILLS